MRLRAARIQPVPAAAAGISCTARPHAAVLVVLSSTTVLMQLVVQLSGSETKTLPCYACCVSAIVTL